MLDATGPATAGLLLLSHTVTGPGPALHSSLAVPVTELPPTTVVGASVNDSRATCRTVSHKPGLAVRPYIHNDHYWQVYFDTNRAIRDTFGTAGYPVPEAHVQLPQREAA